MSIYGKAAIKRISDAIKKGGHIVATFEGDKQLIANLEDFMPRVVKGERPGMVFNVSYGIQGQARYTHVPGILEMVGIPYIGSGPLAHSLALDKVVAKMIFQQNGLPTPEFAVLDRRDFEMPELVFPLIVKPKNESVSFGLKIVHNEEELREGAQVIFNEYDQAVLVEQYIEGREINVGLLGNMPPEPFPPVEIIFEGEGPAIYTYEDKTKKSGRNIVSMCPADIPKEIWKKAQELSVRAFNSLGCYDFARVDMRMDDKGNLYILEINSLASLGIGGSYVRAAKEVGLDFTTLVNRMIEVASSRYFGTPSPPKIKSLKTMTKKDMAFLFLTERRDQIERRIQFWCNISSRTLDPVGIRMASQELHKTMTELKMTPREDQCDERSTWLWNTPKGFEGGTVLIGHLDSPLPLETPPQAFRRDPENLYGEAIASSRAPIVMLEYALKTLKAQKNIKNVPLGILFYADEGMDARFSEKIIKNVAKKAGRVIVLQPGNLEEKAIDSRRGLITYRLIVEGRPVKLGKAGKHPQVMLWAAKKIIELEALSSRSKRMALSAKGIKTEAFPMLLPHRVAITLMLSYYDAAILKTIQQSIQQVLGKKNAGLTWELEEISDRPPMRERKINQRLVNSIKKVALEWEIPFETTSSLWPSVAGLVPSMTPVICGMGPVAEQLYEPLESIQRIGLIQRTLLLTQYLITTMEV